MGRRPWTTRLLVEECAVRISVADVLPLLPSTSNSTGTFTWTTSGGNELGRADYRVLRNDQTGLIIAISNRYGMTVTGDTLRLTRVRSRLGRSRNWLICHCGRAVERLYLPPGKLQFGCRSCFGLSYSSTRRHDPRDSRRRAAIRAALQTELEPLLLRAFLIELPSYFEELGVAMPRDVAEQIAAALTHKNRNTQIHHGDAGHVTGATSAPSMGAASTLRSTVAS